MNLEVTNLGLFVDFQMCSQLGLDENVYFNKRFVHYLEQDSILFDIYEFRHCKQLL